MQFWELLPYGYAPLLPNGQRPIAQEEVVILSYDSYMLFQLNFKSGKAVYLQLVDQVRLAAAAGRLQAGESLPAIRPLAEELRVNRNTVAKAYAELESQGVIETIVGKGCFVRTNNSPFKKDVRRKLLAESIDEAVVHAHHLQIAKDEFLRLGEERFAVFEQKRARAALV
jgi:GntR family transcriptional regulator